MPRGTFKDIKVYVSVATVEHLLRDRHPSGETTCPCAWGSWDSRTWGEIPRLSMVSEPPPGFVCTARKQGDAPPHNSMVEVERAVAK